MLGIIGGSGLYDLALSHVSSQPVDTPYGPPSDAVTLGEISGKRVAFLPRHGQGHRLSPSEINYRANIFALKSLGCTEVLSVSAVGSLRKKLAPGHMVVVDQFIDRTRRREATFFREGVVAHVAMGQPVCAPLSRRVFGGATEFGVAHDGGTYVCIEGPQFSTRAESKEWRLIGADVIGMTNAPEYKLAREAQLCYATLALVTDYDAWRETHVTVEEVVAVLKANVASARKVVEHVAASFVTRECACRVSLANAVISKQTSIHPVLSA